MEKNETEILEQQPNIFEMMANEFKALSDEDKAGVGKVLESMVMNGFAMKEAGERNELPFMTDPASPQLATLTCPCEPGCGKLYPADFPKPAFGIGEEVCFSVGSPPKFFKGVIIGTEYSHVYDNQYHQDYKLKYTLKRILADGSLGVPDYEATEVFKTMTDLKEHWVKILAQSYGEGLESIN